MGVSRKFQGCFKKFSRMYQESFKEVSRVFHDFQGCFLNVSRKFQENFHGVSKQFHVSWHSSQLPEQKEGLFSCYSVKYIQDNISTAPDPDLARMLKFLINDHILCPTLVLVQQNLINYFPSEDIRKIADIFQKQKYKKSKFILKFNRGTSVL